MRELLHKFLRFVMVSGVGWLIDFGIFYCLTAFLGTPILPANYISSLVSVTFVFLVSTRKILALRKDGLSAKTKYLLYVLYQFALLAVISLAAQWLYTLLCGWSLISAYPVLLDNAKLLAKIIITPITMICNFFVLRFLAERK